MTYRDDHEAALARAAALEEENQRLRDELEKRSRPPEPPPAPEPAVPEPTRAPDDTGRDGPSLFARIGLGVLVALGLVILVGILIAIEPEDPTQKYNDRIGAQNAHSARWEGLTRVEPCLRESENDARWAMRFAPHRYDPRAPSPQYGYVDVGSMVQRLGGRCTYSAFALIVDPELSPEVRRALAAWGTADRELRIAAERVYEYYSNRDWMEDDYAAAPGLWKGLDAPLEAWRARRDEVDRLALPALRVEIAELVAGHEQRAGRDETWWRIEVGLAVWDLIAAGHAAMRDSERGEPVDAARVLAATREPAARVLALGKEAPLEVHRALRDIQSYYLEPLAAGTAGDPAEALSQILYGPRDLIGSIERAAIPGMPPDLP